MIELDVPRAAGFLGTNGVRSWIYFYRGSPKNPRGSGFWIYGPWTCKGTEDKPIGHGRYGAMGDHGRHGWVLRWQVSGGFWKVYVKTFADIMRIAKLGPMEAAKRVEKAIVSLDKAIGINCLSAGLDV